MTSQTGYSSMAESEMHPPAVETAEMLFLTKKVRLRQSKMQTTCNVISLIFCPFFPHFLKFLQNDAIHCDQVCACIHTHMHKYVKCVESRKEVTSYHTFPSGVKEFLELVRKGVGPYL